MPEYSSQKPDANPSSTELSYSSDLKQISTDSYRECRICPRRCDVDRTKGQTGYCHADDHMRIGRAALHHWEEPCISGTRGSGAVFFSGCNLGCVFCQNYEISHTTGLPAGKEISVDELVEIFFQLKDEGAHNINLVTADIYLPSVAEAISRARSQKLDLPFVWNSSSYLTVESLKQLDGLIDIYLPDYKFFSPKSAKKYANAENYPQTASKAIAEMVRQQGKCIFGEDGMIKRGVIVRHLLMPGGLLEAKMILRDLWNSYGNRIYISLLRQYTPLLPQIENHPELQRRVFDREYDTLTEYALSLGITQAYIQESGTASEDYIPEFLTEIKKPAAQP